MWLLAASALAAPPHLSVSAGGVVGAGSSARGDYVTGGPMLAGSVIWHLGPFEPWAGVSGGGLVAPDGNVLYPASLIQGELGLGFGGPRFGAGVYLGAGWPGPVAGLYARAMFGGPSWINIGVEPRLFYLSDSEATALAFLLRVEPARPRRAPKQPEPPPRDAAPPEQPEPPPASEGEGEAIPMDEAPPPPPPSDDASHHDDPY